MSRRLKLLVRRGHPSLPTSTACLLFILGCLGCSAAGGGGAPGRDVAPVADFTAAGDTAAVAQCAADNPFCNRPMTTATTTGIAPADVGDSLAPMPVTCGGPPVALQPAGVNIMLAVDGAASMKRHWPQISETVRKLRESHPGADFGMHVFWSDAIPFDFLMGGSAEADMAVNNTNNGCAELRGRVLATGPNDADALVGALGEGPEGGVIVDIYQVSPLIDALATYLTPDGGLGDPTRTNYLVVFTNGHDNCFGSAFIQGADRKRAYQKLALELDKRNIRLVPVGVDPPPVENDPFAFTPPFEGANFETMVTNYNVLNEMLMHGNSGFTDVPRIDTPDAITQFVSEVGAKFNNCRFQIPQDLDSGAAANPFELSFSINDVTVPRDRRRTDGWDFVNGGTTQVEFYGQACEALQAKNTVMATKSCSRDVCGTAAVGVSTKPRNILLLLDSSQSRTECTVDPVECAFADPADPNRARSYWDVVLQSLGDALIAPVNAEVNFGMQFFPAKTSANFSCEVEPAPEILPASGQQLAILRAMLEKTPHGLSPVVAVMESVAQNPGPLLDPNAINAVVLLSDGGDNCSGAEQPEIVERLGAASRQLLDQGVRTFGVRYGPDEGPGDGRDEQLIAIVENGGTAGMGDKPYIDAKTPEELIEALAHISEQFSTCAFALNGLPTDVDKSTTNLYLNGEPVGFDASNTGAEGWHWVDPAMTTVELLGESCSAFKNSTRSNIFVEFGCEPEILF